MNALEIAAKVAAHPVLVKLRMRQEMMRRAMVRDYGHDFMMSGKDMPNMILPNGRKSPRSEGVHYWTPAQRDEWLNLERRMQNTRNALKNVYATV